jgi:hypothetical protein
MTSILKNELGTFFEILVTMYRNPECDDLTRNNMCEKHRSCIEQYLRIFYALHTMFRKSVVLPSSCNSAFISIDNLCL